MITAYELSPLNTLEIPGSALSKSGEGQGALKRLTARLLKDLDVPEGSPLHHRIMERMALLSAEDIPLVLSVVSRILKI
jgi:hypothetical protein